MAMLWSKAVTKRAMNRSRTAAGEVCVVSGKVSGGWAVAACALGAAPDRAQFARWGFVVALANALRGAGGVAAMPVADVESEAKEDERQERESKQDSESKGGSWAKNSGSQGGR